MARKATPTGGARKGAKPAAKKAGRKSTAPATPRKPAKAAKPKRAVSATRKAGRSGDMTASEALVKLIESPLVADLLAVGATAALAAIASHKFSGARSSGGAVKAAGKAAASAMGRRISTEVEEIRKVSKAKDETGD
jgi:hypothetical protein